MFRGRLSKMAGDGSKCETLRGSAGDAPCGASACPLILIFVTKGLVDRRATDSTLRRPIRA
jgi:hypothetical protein